MMQRLFLLFGIVLVFVACAHLPPEDYGFPPHPSSSPSSTPSGSPSPTPTPGPCATEDVTDANVVYVSINPDVTPAKDSANNDIFGYAPYDINGGGAVPGTSAVVPMSSTQLLQFVNTDLNPNNVSHSAVGFAQNGFPATPYTFPAGSDLPIGHAVTTTPTSGGGSPWSTGEIAPGCFSQVFTVTQGTFYFGDFNTYNTGSSMRDEIVVTL